MFTENDFILDSCKATPGFEFYLKKKDKIDLSKLVKILDGSPFYISKDNSPFYLHIKNKDAEVTVFSSLKIIIKDLLSEDKAKKIFLEILELINKV